MSCFKKSEDKSEDDLPPLQQPVSPETKMVMTDCVVECLLAHQEITFESSSGASLLSIITEIVAEESNHAAKDSAYLKYAIVLKKL